MIIVYVNQEDQKISIFSDNKVEILDWNEIDRLESLIGYKNVLYIESLVEVTGDDVINLISEYINPSKKVTKASVANDGKLYVRAARGSANIPIGEGKSITFEGISHFIPLEDFGGYEGLRSYPILQQALDRGVIEIVSASQKSAIIAESNKRKSPKDISADNILFDRKTGEHAKSTQNITKNEGSAFLDDEKASDEAVAVDLDNEDFNSDVEEEFFKSISDAGIDIDVD